MIRISVAWSWLAVTVLAVSGITGAERVFEEQLLFQSRTKGYHTVRIPSLIVTKQGTVLALCEGRKNSAADHGDIDLLMRPSHDGGKTWGAIRVVAEDGEHTIGNPCPVIDRTTGTIWLPYSRDNRQVLIIHSQDDGKTWSEPVEITKSVLHRDWHWVGPGPGHGIQLRNGRLLIPAWAGVERDVPFGRTQLSYVFFSDDSGKTWQFGQAAQRDLSD